MGFISPYWTIFLPIISAPALPKTILKRAPILTIAFDTIVV
jgi:hypothetical protein